MPRLLRLLSPRKAPAPAPPGGMRRMSASKSTGDLVGLLNSEYANTPLVPTFGTLPKIQQPTPQPPNPLALDDSVTCGYLYRLTYTGLWFTLWMELRFSYLLCFYEQTDDQPMDMTNLHGYTVRMAPECDHLEGLYPIKLIKQGERTIFLFADSEEGRIEWMAAFFRASSHRLPLTIEGLNLEFEGNDAYRSNTVTTLIRNIPDKKQEVASEIAPEDENEEERHEENDEFEESLDDIKGRFSPNVNAEDILNKYETAQALTEHEGLRIRTYYWQRRLSAQIKVQTLKEQLDEPHTEKVSPINKARHKIVEEKLLELEHRLCELDTEKEKASKNVELTLHELENKKTEELKSAKVTCTSHEPPETKIKYIEEHKPKPRCSSTSEAEEVHHEEHKSKSFFKKRPSPLKIGRHKTFSPGDWAQYPGTAPIPNSAPNTNGNGKPQLKKAGSLQNLLHSFSSIRDPHIGSQSPKPKRQSPLRLISNAVRSNNHKRAHSDFTSNPSSPMTSPVASPLVSPFSSPNFIISSSEPIRNGTATLRERKDKSPRPQIQWRHSSYEKYLSPTSEFSPCYTLSPDPLSPLIPNVTANRLSSGSPQSRPRGSPLAIESEERNKQVHAVPAEVASNGSVLNGDLEHAKKNKVRTKIKRIFTFNAKTTKAYQTVNDAH